MIFEPAQSPDYSRYKALKFELRDRIMTVTLSNPGRRNAVTPRMSDELVTVWDDLWADPAVSVIILTGEGDSFCSGADVSQLAEIKAADAPPPRSVVNQSSRLARKHVLGIVECEKPVIAKVRGVAFGMGLSLALACDMVFAAEGTRLCDSHVKIGLVAGDGGVLLWPLAVGLHRAKEYLMTGEVLTAKTAEEIGLINRCLPEEQLDAHVQTLAEKLRDLPPHAVNYTKSALNMVLKQLTQPAFETSLAYEIYTMSMNDMKEATAAFKEKRKGRFTGT
jgi:enoyl-CoA hydratase